MILLLFVSLKRDGYMAVSQFFTQSFAFLLNTARSFGYYDEVVVIIIYFLR